MAAILGFIAACEDRPDERSAASLLQDMRQLLPCEYSAVLACETGGDLVGDQPRVLFQWCGEPENGGESERCLAPGPCGAKGRLAQLLERVGCGPGCTGSVAENARYREAVGLYLSPCRTSDNGSQVTCMLFAQDPDRIATGKEVAILRYVTPHLESLMRRLRKLARTECFRGISPCILAAAQESSAEGLTPRENEVLRWVGEGKNNWEIGSILSISERTVKFHLANIFRKLDVLNRAQAVASAFRIEGSSNN